MSKFLRNFNIENVELVNFVNLDKELLEMVRRWRNHENVRKWMYTDHMISRDEHLRFVRRLKSDKKNFYWLAVDKLKNEPVGIIYLNRVDLRNRNAYLGIYANPERRIKGAGSILMMCIEKLAFEFAKLHTLKLEVMEGNEKAIKLYKRFGFKEEGRLKEFVFREGRWIDVIIMGKLEIKK
jgi:UDP-4-amino-4,6-dideoxy-N-acetyl-beta-L-altrosamine N-acetyltransferase